MHSLVFVIVPPTAADAVAEVSRLMQGRTRNYETYQLPCSCIGEAARNEAWRHVNGTPEGQRWLQELQLARERQDETTERDILRQRYRSAQSIERAHPLFGRVTDDCDICEGRGVNDFSRDPAEHYDWWQVGDRWGGLLGPVSGPLVVAVDCHS